MHLVSKPLTLRLLKDFSGHIGLGSTSHSPFPKAGEYGPGIKNFQVCVAGGLNAVFYPLYLYIS